MPVLPPTTPEQRQQLWEDVEAILTPGFISHPLRIGAVQVCLRSPYPQDSGLVDARVGVDTSTRTWQAWTLAGCTWMVDGQVLLANKNAAVSLYRMYSVLPRAQLDRIFTCVLGLWRRYSEAVRRSMTYCYENSSRTLWQGYGRLPPTQWPMYDGLGFYGLNHVQQTWVAYNQYKDASDQQQWDWQCAKLVASSMAKGVDKIDKQDTTRREQEEDRQQREKDTLYYRIAGLLTEDGEQATQEGGPKTFEDLEKEMQNWVAGEQDQHDNIVASYKADIIARRQQEDQDRARRLAQLAELQRRKDENAPTSTPALVGYTSEQLAKIMPKGGRGSNVRTVVEESPAGRLYDRHVAGQQISSASMRHGPAGHDAQVGGN